MIKIITKNLIYKIRQKKNKIGTRIKCFKTFLLGKMSCIKQDWMSEVICLFLLRWFQKGFYHINFIDGELCCCCEWIKCTEVKIRSALVLFMFSCSKFYSIQHQSRQSFEFTNVSGVNRNVELHVVRITCLQVTRGTGNVYKGNRRGPSTEP